MLINKVKSLSLVLLLVSSGVVSMGCTKEKDVKVQDTTVESKKENDITIGESSYSTPVSVSDLTKQGYVLDLKDDIQLPAGVYYNSYIKLNLNNEYSGVSVKVVNYSDTNKLISESDIYSIKFSNDSIKIEDTITVGSSVEDLQNKFGKPFYEDGNGDITYMGYRVSGKGHLKVEVVDNKVITIEYIFEEVDEDMTTEETAK